METPMTQLLDELERLLAAATPGPWHFGNPWEDRCVSHAPGGTDPPDYYAGPDGNTDRESLVNFHTPHRIVVTSWAAHSEDDGLVVTDHDAALIVAAVNALPALIAAARDSEGWRESAIVALRQPLDSHGLLMVPDSRGS